MGRLSRQNSEAAFAIAEIMIALAMVTGLTLLIGFLGKQAMNFSRSTRQTAAVLEMRSRTNSMTRNPTAWLDKMRSSVATNGLYAGCLPDKTAATTTFDCPTVLTDDQLTKLDPELKKIAGTDLYVASVPIVDNLGEKIAGTTNDPTYLDSEGRTCTLANSATSCPMKSTGYLMRTNIATDKNPGSVKFVVKIERNSESTSTTGSSPMRAQYMTLNIGTDWQDSSSCPAGTIKLAYIEGTAVCVNPTIDCTGGKLSVGINESGNPICKLVTPCLNGNAVLDPKTQDIVCSLNSPCTGSTVFTGYLSGTGEAICQSTDADLQCKPGEAQVGQTIISGVYHATCSKFPSCLASQKISYDGSKFVCAADTPEAAVPSDKLSCADGEVVYGMNKDGSVKCRAESNLATLCSQIAGATWDSEEETCNVSPPDYAAQCLHIQGATWDGNTCQLSSAAPGKEAQYISIANDQGISNFSARAGDYSWRYFIKFDSGVTPDSLCKAHGFSSASGSCKGQWKLSDPHIISGTIYYNHTKTAELYRCSMGYGYGAAWWKVSAQILCLP